LKGKVKLSSVRRQAVPQSWSSNWECPIAETSVGTWNNKRSQCPTFEAEGGRRALPRVATFPAFVYRLVCNVCVCVFLWVFQLAADRLRERMLKSSGTSAAARLIIYCMPDVFVIEFYTRDVKPPQWPRPRAVLVALSLAASLFIRKPLLDV